MYANGEPSGMGRILSLSRYDMRSLLEDQDSIRRKASRTIHNLMEELVPYEHQYKVDLGRAHLHPCDDSPFGLCAYNVRDLGSRYDSCIFCGEPDERK
jgi:hypothetical protein